MSRRRLPEPPSGLTPETREYLRSLVKVLNLEFQDLDGVTTPEIALNQVSLVNVSSGYKAGDRSYIFVDASASAVSVVLPNPSDRENYFRRIFSVKKTNTNANDITVTVSASGTIDGATSYILTGAAKPAITLISDGTEYKIV